MRRHALLAAVAPVFALVTACSSTTPNAQAPRVPSVTTAPPTTSASATPAPPPTTTDPGLLPQTHVLPNADDPRFQAGVQGLWQAVVTGDPTTALPFFFPETAYLQVKADRKSVV